MLHSVWDLGFPTGDRACAPAMEAQRPGLWASRESPYTAVFVADSYFTMIQILIYCALIRYCHYPVFCLNISNLASMSLFKQTLVFF